ARTPGDRAAARDRTARPPRRAACRAGHLALRGAGRRLGRVRRAFAPAVDLVGRHGRAAGAGRRRPVPALVPDRVGGSVRPPLGVRAQRAAVCPGRTVRVDRTPTLLESAAGDAAAWLVRLPY